MLFQFAIHVTAIIISLLAAVFNFVGIYFLTRTNDKQSHQILIIKHIAAADIVSAFGWIVVDINIIKGGSIKFVDQIATPMSRGFYCTWYLLLCTLTLDRFLGGNFPLWYRCKVTKKHIKTVTMASWLVGTVIGVFGCTVNIKLIFQNYIWVILSGLFLFIFSMTYSTIICRMNQGPPPGTQRAKSNNKKIMRMVICMSLGFLLFEVVPNVAFVIVTFTMKIKSDIFHGLILLVYRFNQFVDPFIYVFMLPDVKNIVHERLKICKQKQNKTTEESQVEVPNQVKISSHDNKAFQEETQL